MNIYKLSHIFLKISFTERAKGLDVVNILEDLRVMVTI
jgi:hypothetical protein